MTLELLRSREAARLLGVGLRTLCEWRRRRIGPAYIKMPMAVGPNGGTNTGGVVCYSVTDLLDFAEARRVEAERMPRPFAGRMPKGSRRERIPTCDRGVRT
jgi:hypothetical protein